MYKDKEKQREGHVYVVKCGDKPYYKIGVTQSSVASRVATLQTGCPFKLHLVEAFWSYNAIDLETTIQEAFKANRVQGEWYLLDTLRLDTLLGLFSGQAVSVFENEEERIRHEIKEHRPSTDAWRAERGR